MRFKLWQWVLLLALWLDPLSASAANVVAEGRPVLGGPEYVTLRSAWYEVQASLSREEWSEAQGSLAQVRKLKINLGLPNLFGVSSVLIRAASRASESGADDVALSFAESAHSISPDMTATHFEHAARTFNADVFELPEALKHLRRGYELLGDDPHGASVFAANFTSGVVLLTVLMLVFFFCVHLVRYGDCLVRDIQRLLRGSIDRFQGWFLYLALALTPMLLGLGLVITLTIGLVVLSAYAKRAERGLTILILAAVGGLSLASDTIDRAARYPSSPESTVHRCNMGECSQNERLRLDSLSKDPAYKYAASYTLALLRLRSLVPDSDRLDEARLRLKTAWSTDDTWQVRVLHGNVAYAQALTHCEAVLKGDESSKLLYTQGLEEARSYWDIAQGKNPDSLEAHYNLAVVAQLLGDADTEASHLKEANRIDAARVGAFQDNVSEGRTNKRCSYWSQPNRHVMTPHSPWDDRAGGYFDVRGNALGIRAPLSGLLSGPNGHEYTESVGWIGAGLVFILLLLGRFHFLSCPCRKCPSVADPTSRVDVPSGAVCNDCVLADVGRGVVDAKSQWRSEQRVNVRRARRIRIQQLTSWIMPGFATALMGRPIRGLLASGIFLGSLLWATDVHVVVDYVHRISGPSLGRTVPLVLVACVIYIVSLVRVHRRRGLHE